ncbi:hypothetical protein C8R43DRAFT_1121161 [Mycena crocata]|nr:hypothetical protein C8R43DRAFT_1121161 [Mycena crocata]
MPPPGFKAPSMKELRRIEAEIRAIVPPACTKCAAQQSQYRCWECPVRFCKKCVLTHHARLPLHSIEIYAGPTRGFVRHTLQSLGMHIPLGHDGSTCPERVTDTNVAIASTNGVHNVTVDFCGCGDKSFAQQLMDARILPSSTDTGANTAATFQLVGHFDVMNDYVEQHWSQRPIIIQRTVSEHILQGWAALNELAWRTMEMGQGERGSLDHFIQCSLEIGRPHPSRLPSNAPAAKIKLLTVPEEFLTNTPTSELTEVDNVSSAGCEGEESG